MSKRIFKNLDDFIEIHNPNIEELNEFLVEEIIEDPINPTNKTILTRYSKVKNYIREKYKEISEAELKQIKPPAEIVNSVLENDAKLKETKKNIKFNQELVDKILSYKDSKNLYEKFIYLQFISGRRISEIKEFDNIVKLFKNNNNEIKMKLNKKKHQNFEIVKIMPNTIEPSEFKKQLKKLRDVIEEIDTGDYTKRLNRFIKKNLGKDYTTHSLRGMYGSYMFNKHNPENLNINAYLKNLLNHDSIDSSISYSNYQFEK